MPRNVHQRDGSSPPPVRATLDEMKAVRDRVNRASTDFLKLDVETALMFADIARHTNEKIKRQRNVEHARQGYDTIQRLSQKIALSRADKRFLAEKMNALRLSLIALGEPL